MTRSRLLVIASMVVVVLGALAGLGALWLNPLRAAVGPLPGEALVLPADARWVLGLDVQRFAASPFYARFAAQPGMKPGFSLMRRRITSSLHPWQHRHRP